MAKKDYVIDLSDMGFSFGDDIVKENNDTKQEIEATQQRLDDMYTLFVAFLDNLAKDPERTTLVWPNRAEKIAEFKKTITKIKEGK